MRIDNMVSTSRTRPFRHPALELRLTQLLLGLMLIGLFVVNKGISGWPVVTWPMYSQRTYTRPPPVASAVELRVIAANQQVRHVKASDLLTMGRSGMANRILKAAFQEPDPARRHELERYVAAVVLRHTGLEPPVQIEVWEHEWHVEPMRMTPLTYEEPHRRARWGTLRVTADGAVIREP